MRRGEACVVLADPVMEAGGCRTWDLLENSSLCVYMCTYMCVCIFACMYVCVCVMICIMYIYNTNVFHEYISIFLYQCHKRIRLIDPFFPSIHYVCLLRINTY